MKVKLAYMGISCIDPTVTEKFCTENFRFRGAKVLNLDEAYLAYISSGLRARISAS